MKKSLYIAQDLKTKIMDKEMKNFFYGLLALFTITTLFYYFMVWMAKAY